MDLRQLIPPCGIIGDKNRTPDFSVSGLCENP